jgi:hypothetical protein
MPISPAGAIVHDFATASETASHLAALSAEDASAGNVADAIDAAQQAVSVLERADAPPDQQPDYQIMLAEARHNLIARLIGAQRPQQAIALADETISGYQAYAAMPGADLARVARDLAELAGQLQGIGDTAHAAEARQAANDLMPPG